MQFQYRNCEPDENDVFTRTCHCAEGMFINGNKNLDQYEEGADRDIVEAIRNAWGQFYRDGTFPAGTLKDYREVNGEFNVIDSEFRTEAVFSDECAALDAVDNYLWDKTNF